MGFFDDGSGSDEDDDQRKKNRPTMMMMSLESLTGNDEGGDGHDDDDDDPNKEFSQQQQQQQQQQESLIDANGNARDDSKQSIEDDDVTGSAASAIPDVPRYASNAQEAPFNAGNVNNQEQDGPETDTNGKQGKDDNDGDGDGDGDGEVDPLDAYMNSLDQQQKPDPKAPYCSNKKDNPGGRLDMDNEDEATGHWQEPSSATISSQMDDQQVHDPSSASSSNDFYGSFHKASRHYSKNEDAEDRDVNIRLQHVQHDQIKYPPFKKCFLDLQEHNNGNDQSNSHNHSRGSNRNTYEGQKWRKQHAVLCTPPLDPIYDFAELRDVLPSQVVEWNVQNNLTNPTLVQSQTLGVALCGKDAIVTASTGSGKTLAYLWPCVTHLMENSSKVESVRDSAGAASGNIKGRRSRALVLVPTRELALQVEKVAKSLFTNLPLTALAITGGNMGRYQLSQKLQASKPHLVVATPGRLLDVLSAQQKNKQDWLLPNITFLVLDEADKMISLGFANQVTQILQSLRPDRQSLLTSATFDSRLHRRCQEWMHSPTRISVGKTGESSKHVLQHVVCLPTLGAKLDFLRQSLPTFTAVGRTLVFCRTREGVDQLASELKSSNILVETMHGDKHPVDRKAALKSFTQGNVKVLLATDVAGRGLDIPQVATVINFDPAKNWDTHVHRIGRAGRMSSKEQQRQEGSAYTLLLPSNIDFAKALVRAYEREGRTVPDDVRTMVNHQPSHHGGGNHHGKRPRTNNDYGGRNEPPPSSSSSRSSNHHHPAGLGFHDEPPNKKDRYS